MVGGLRRSGDTGERAVAARALAFLFASGGLLALATIVVRHPGTWDGAGIALCAGVALLTAAVLLIGAGRLPYISYFLALMLSIFLIDSVIVFTGEVTSPYVAFYTWSALFAFYFLTGGEAVAIVLWSSGNYGLILHALGAGGEDLPRWMMVDGTIVVIGSFIWFLRRRERRLIERLEDAAQRDHLTGCLNRRGFERAFDGELERARRAHGQLALIVCDLDHFKQLNDEHGHPAGDLVLRHVADLLDTHKRRIDTLVRLGGEEFGLLLPATSADGAFIVAERLRRAVKDSRVDGGMRLTASFGIAAYPRDGQSAATLLSAADQALYAAKQFGRDGVVIHSSDLTLSVLALTGRGAATDVGRLEEVVALAEAVDLRDVRTAEHSRTVGRFARMIAERLGLSPDHAARIALAGVLHDIGKVGISPSILSKPGPLDADEEIDMRRHCEIGSQMLREARLDDVADWVIAHHERPDGNGYPFALAGDDIPLEARILSVADSYEAMIADRSYRAGIGHAAAQAELISGRGTQFDPDIVDAFLRALGESRAETVELAVGPRL